MYVANVWAVTWLLRAASNLALVYQFTKLRLEQNLAHKPF